MIKNRHGQFLNEEQYVLWCKIKNKKPFYSEPVEADHKNKIQINDNYDIETRLKKNEE